MANRNRGHTKLEKLFKHCNYPNANTCQSCTDCSLGTTTFDEDKIEIEKFSPAAEGIYALRAHQLLNGSPAVVIQMLRDYDLGKTVREHFTNSGSSMLLRSDIKSLL
jgi:hypothetical protein